MSSAVQTSPLMSPATSPTGFVRGDMTFASAMQRVVDGERITKREWGNEGTYVALIDGFLKIHHADGREDALLVRDADMLGVDWYVLRSH